MYRPQENHGCACAIKIRPVACHTKACIRSLRGIGFIERRQILGPLSFGMLYEALTVHVQFEAGRSRAETRLKAVVASRQSLAAKATGH
jgi:hypothetical protein